MTRLILFGHLVTIMNICEMTETPVVNGEKSFVILNETNPMICSDDQPDKSIPLPPGDMSDGSVCLPGSVRCAQQCRRESACVGFNFKFGADGMKCELYFHLPTNFSNSDACYYFQLKSLVGASRTNSVALPPTTSPNVRAPTATPTVAVCPSPDTKDNSSTCSAMNYSSQIQSILYCPPSYVNVTMINCSWILIQQNFLQNSATAFYRSWIEYKNGFSDTYGNLWFGNEKLSLLTLNWKWRLRVEVQSYGTNKWYFAEYESITVLNETNKYQLEVFNYSGNAHDGLGGYSDSSHWSANGSKFSTYDSDNTAISGGRNCPINNKGGWWYKLCGGAVLNGNGMNGWAFFKSDFGAATNQMAGSRMMIQLI